MKQERSAHYNKCPKCGAELTEREQNAFIAARPKSRAAYANAEHLFGRVPMTWMNKKSGAFPIYLDRAHGNRVWDIDGHEYIDFALGDTGAMAGHSPEATVKAVHQRIGVEGGITTMMPSADAEWVAADLTRRFGLPLWSFALTATDAEDCLRKVIQLITEYCYGAGETDNKKQYAQLKSQPGV